MATPDPQRYRRLLDLLGEALDQPEDARGVWAEQLTGEDIHLKPDLLRILSRQHESALAAHIESGAAAMLPADSDDNEATHHIGDTVGPYVLEAALGTGGMGTVWRAREGGNPALPSVAIKLPSMGHSSRGATERLQREGHILAALNHPNIARIIGTGATVVGAPYLVLEYVDGESLHAHCDRQALDTAARLKLFVKVLDAVAYAHASLILHRDLKPANVMVNTSGEVKLLDFGIAKLIDNSGTARATELTRAAGRAMTPDYASPEQIAGLPLTVASDVYSLGVMLFELLTGERPYQLHRGSAAELEEAILHADTRRPSTAVGATFAQKGCVTLSKLKREISGDADTVILKALKKVPAERYATAAAFRDDVQRFIDGRPVLATPDSLGYRARKFAGRNRLAVGAAAAVFLAMAAGLAIALWQANVARAQARAAAEARAKAEQRFNDVRGVANALVFDVHDALQYVPGTVEARKLLNQKAVEFLDKVSAEAHGDPAVLRELAAGYRKIAEAQNYALAANLGDAKEANRNQEKAIALLKPLAEAPNATKEDIAALALAELSHGQNHFEQGDLSRAMALTQHGHHAREALLAADPGNADLSRDMATADTYMANVLAEQGDLQGALRANQAVLDRFVELVKADPKSARNRWGLICGYANTAANLMALKRNDDARQRFERALSLAIDLTRDKPDHYTLLAAIATYQSRLGELAVARGEFKTGADQFERAVRDWQGLVRRDAHDKEAAKQLAETRAALGHAQTLLSKSRAQLSSMEDSVTALRTLLAARPDSRRLDTALINALVLQGQAALAARDPHAACKGWAEARNRQSNLAQRLPGLASVTAIAIPPCPAKKQG
ncbi:MAG: protein kinase [Betaproteobacteria bacterium]|nr:protein kinase [Betaproteobacteria bacterium]